MGMERIYDEGGLEELLAQVHDSCFYQYPCLWKEMAEFILWVINDAMSIPIDYGTGEFHLGVDCKAGYSRGDMHTIKIGSLQDIADQLEAIQCP